MPCCEQYYCDQLDLDGAMSLLEAGGGDAALVLNEGLAASLVYCHCARKIQFLLLRNHTK